MKSSFFLAIAIVTTLLQIAPLEAQEPTDTKVVLRVSRKFIQRLTGVRFQKEEPIDSNTGGVAVNGTASVTGKFRIVLHESKSQGNFDIQVSGDVAIQLSAVRRPVEILAHSTASYNGRRRVIHNGDLLSAEAMTIDVKNHFTLDDICPLRSGLGGAITRRAARPFVQRGLAAGDRQAENEIRSKLAAGLDTELDRLVAALNQIPLLVKQTHKLIIAENKVPGNEMRHYLAATKDHLLFSIGPANRRIPDVPGLGKEDAAPVELWIAESKNELKEERRKFMMQNWNLVAPILLLQLERRSPELATELDVSLAKALEEVHIFERPGWHVVTFAPKIEPRTIEIP